MFLQGKTALEVVTVAIDALPPAQRSVLPDCEARVPNTLTP